MNNDPVNSKFNEALAKAQSKLSSVQKDSNNPHFKSRYASLAAVNEAIAPIHSEGFSVSHKIGGGFVTTSLLHSVGCLTSEFPIPQREMKAQEIGSWISYAKRYNIMALLNLAAEDDDGNEAQKSPPVALQEDKPKTHSHASPNSQSPQEDVLADEKTVAAFDSIIAEKKIPIGVVRAALAKQGLLMVRGSSKSKLKDVYKELSEWKVE